MATINVNQIRQICWNTIAEVLGIPEPTSTLTGASATTFLRGDGTWAVPASDGTGFALENRTSDPVAPVTGQIWLRTDL